MWVVHLIYTMIVHITYKADRPYANRPTWAEYNNPFKAH